MKSSSSKRTVWIFTIIFAVVVKLTAISCLMVYLIDQQLLNSLSKSQGANVSNAATNKQTEEEEIIPVDENEEEAILVCTPLSCDPQCIAEWFEGNYTCEINTNVGPVDFKQKRPTKAKHRAKLLSSRKLTQVAGLTNIDRMFAEELDPLLIPRVPGTPGNQQARRHIIQRLERLGGWEIVQDAFSANTPMGQKDFVNIVATLNPTTERRLVLACHYDSKYFAPRLNDKREFVGATDSAVPCAMLLDLAYSLDEILKASPLEMVTLQLIFFDGEEAFRSWSETDSLYGSRHLASTWEATTYPKGSKSGTTELSRMDMLVLLDLIGVRDPTFLNHFPSQTGKWFQHMQKVESRLSTAGLLQFHREPYFKRGGRAGGIEDDHIPFLRRDIACFHIIATPFPKAWHRVEDDKDSLDKDTIDNLNKMLQVFTTEFLHLKLATKEAEKPVE